MKAFHILFAIGKDRPGIVGEVSSFLTDRGANIEDSRMAAMGGRFTLNLLFSIDANQATRITAELTTLHAAGLECSLHSAEDPSALKRGSSLPLKLSIQTMDHVGVVKKVVRVLHAAQANIEYLDTQITHAPFSGEAIFNLSLTASIPAEQSIPTVKKNLLQLADEENLDLNFA